MWAAGRPGRLLVLWVDASSQLQVFGSLNSATGSSKCHLACPAGGDRDGAGLHAAFRRPHITLQQSRSTMQRSICRMPSPACLGGAPRAVRPARRQVVARNSGRSFYDPESEDTPGVATLLERDKR